MTAEDLPPWSFQPCSGCGRAVPPAAHDLTCHFFDIRTLIAVAWVANTATSAYYRELDDRALRYFNQPSQRLVSDHHRRPPPTRHRSLPPP
jgi:hypothetical protein